MPSTDINNPNAYYYNPNLMHTVHTTTRTNTNNTTNNTTNTTSLNGVDINNTNGAIPRSYNNKCRNRPICINMLTFDHTPEPITDAEPVTDSSSNTISECESPVDDDIYNYFAQDFLGSFQ